MVTNLIFWDVFQCGRQSAFIIVRIIPVTMFTQDIYWVLGFLSFSVGCLRCWVLRCYVPDSFSLDSESLGFQIFKDITLKTQGVFFLGNL